MTKIFKFVHYEVPTIEQLKDAKAVRLRHHIDNGGILTRKEKDWITEAVRNNNYFKRAVPVQGWCVPFDDILRRFVFKQYGEWKEIWAMDKTAIRHTVFGRIDEIVELKTN